jgi:tryptophan synthase alpha subunit
MFLNKNPGGVGVRKPENSNNYGHLPSSGIISGGSTTNNFDESEQQPANEFKNKQINELTDMVKVLLEEQRQLK